MNRKLEAQYCEEEGAIIKYLAKIPRSKNSFVVMGVPSLFDLGANTVRFLVDTFEAEEVAEIYFHGFASFVSVMPDGTVFIPHMNLYHKEMNGNKHLFFLFGSGVLENQDFYDFSKVILKLLKEIKPKLTIVLGGVKGLTTKMEISGAASDKGSFRLLTQKNVKPMKGRFAGVEGHILTLSGEEKINSIVLSLNYQPDREIEAMKKLISTLTEFIGVEINLRKLDELGRKAKDMSEKFSEIINQVYLKKERGMEVI